MILIVLLVVVVFAIAYSSSRHPGAPARTSQPGAAHDAAPEIQRWVDAGLLSPEQADSIRAFEVANAAAPRPRPRVSPVLEALSYVGGILLAVGAGMLVARSWDELGTAGHLAVLVVAASVTGVSGVLVGEDDALTWRLRGFLWSLSTAATAGAVGVAAYEILDLTDEPLALLVAGSATLHAAICWQRRERPLQHLLTIAGVGVMIGVALAWAGDDGAFIGLALWLLGAVWAWLAWRDRVPPAAVGFALGTLVTLIACAFVGNAFEALAPLAGLATAALWLTAGVTTNEPLALAPGVLGVFVYLPWTLGYFFGETLGAPAVAMGSGIVLLVVVLLLVRRGRGDGTAIRVHHFGQLAKP